MYSLDLKIRAINAYKTTKYTYRFISNLFGISKTTVHRWVKKCNNKMEISKPKINVDVLNYLKHSTTQNPFKRLVDFQIIIKKKFNLDVSLTTISKYMKICGISKKKIVKRIYNCDIKTHKQKRRDFMKQIKKINKDDIICLDETYINPKIYSNYGWSKINNKIVKFYPYEKRRKESILMAISQNGIMKYEIIRESYNKTNFKSFIEKLINENGLKNKYILMDNVAFHKNKDTIKYIENTGNKVLFIPPYSPDFNPIEEVFSYIKSGIRNNISYNLLHKQITRYLNKLMIKINVQKKPFEKYYLRAFR